MTVFILEIPTPFYPANKKMKDFPPIFNAEFRKGIVSLDLRWKYDIKLVPANRLVSDWLPNQAG